MILGSPGDPKRTPGRGLPQPVARIGRNLLRQTPSSFPVECLAALEGCFKRPRRAGPWASARSAMVAHVGERVDHVALVPDLEMHVRSGGTAGGAGLGDHV